MFCCLFGHVLNVLPDVLGQLANVLNLLADVLGQLKAQNIPHW